MYIQAPAACFIYHLQSFDRALCVNLWRFDRYVCVTHHLLRRFVFCPSKGGAPGGGRIERVTPRGEIVAGPYSRAEGATVLLRGTSLARCEAQHRRSEEKVSSLRQFLGQEQLLTKPTT